jgi:CubicO group peptidase (beta-lactamase class C family)
MIFLKRLDKMKNIMFLVLSFGLLFTGCNSQNQSGTNDLGNFIQKKVDSLQKKENLPGLYVGVLHSDQRSFYSAGYADPDKKIPFDSATNFEIGSITKTFTAFVLQSVLIEKGIPDTSSILQYLPDSVQSNKMLASISFLNLLNHTSGLPKLPDNMTKDLNSKNPYDNYGQAELFAFLKKVVPKPDGRSNYSNLGFGLAGILAERISGKTYPTLLEEYFFTPFNMKTSSTGNAQGYFGKEKTSFWEMDALSAAGTIKSNAADILTYLQHMAEPPDETTTVVIDKLLEPTITMAPNLSIGKAWLILQPKDNKPTIYWHNGGTYGFSTFAAFDRKNKNAVVVVANEFNKGEVTDMLGLRIMQKLSAQ